MNIYKAFFEAYYKDMEEYFLAIHEGKVQLTKENYYAEALKPTNLSFQDFAGIESKIKMHFPNAFKQFYTTCYSLSKYFQLPVTTLAVPLEDNPFEELNKLLFEQGLSEKMLEQRLIPVGFYQDNFYICLDLRNNNSVHDAPIIYYGLDAARFNEDEVLEENVFPSFENYIQHLTNCILTGIY